MNPSNRLTASSHLVHSPRLAHILFIAPFLRDLPNLSSSKTTLIIICVYRVYLGSKYNKAQFVNCFPSPCPCAWSIREDLVLSANEHLPHPSKTSPERPALINNEAKQRRRACFFLSTWSDLSRPSSSLASQSKAYCQPTSAFWIHPGVTTRTTKGDAERGRKTPPTGVCVVLMAIKATNERGEHAWRRALLTTLSVSFLGAFPGEGVGNHHGLSRLALVRCFCQNVKGNIQDQHDIGGEGPPLGRCSVPNEDPICLFWTEVELG